jgi:hypothetical protein
MHPDPSTTTIVAHLGNMFSYHWALAADMAMASSKPDSPVQNKAGIKRN